MLRNFYNGDNLQYDSNGNLKKGGDPGAWALDGNIKITSIRLRRHQVDIRGVRLFTGWNVGTKQFSAILAGPVHIQAMLDYSLPASVAAQQIFQTIFLGANENTTNLLPNYWRWLIEVKQSRPKEAVVVGEFQGKPVYSCAKVKGQESYPVPISMPDPPYSTQARSVKVQGTVTLGVLLDAMGQVQDLLEMTAPLGFGLDLAAFKTVRDWKFKPALRYGTPVPVVLSVDITFHLF